MYDIYTEACNAPLFFFFANFFLTDALNSTERLLRDSIIDGKNIFSLSLTS